MMPEFENALALELSRVSSGSSPIALIASTPYMMKVAEVEAPPARAPARRGWSVVATACAGALVALSLELTSLEL